MMIENKRKLHPLAIFRITYVFYRDRCIHTFLTTGWNAFNPSECFLVAFSLLYMINIFSRKHVYVDPIYVNMQVHLLIHMTHFLKMKPDLSYLTLHFSRCKRSSTKYISDDVSFSDISVFKKTPLHLPSFPSYLTSCSPSLPGRGGLAEFCSVYFHLSALRGPVCVAVCMCVCVFCALSHEKLPLRPCIMGYVQVTAKQSHPEHTHTRSHT